MKKETFDYGGLLKKKCPKCDWTTFSFLSLDFKYCPECATKLVIINGVS